MATSSVEDFDATNQIILDGRVEVAVNEVSNLTICAKTPKVMKSMDTVDYTIASIQINIPEDMVLEIDPI